MIKKIIVLIACLAIQFPTQAQTNQFKDLTILVSSCDKYSPLWEPFFVSLFKQWPSLQQENSSVPIVLIANKQSYPSTRVKTIQIKTEISWSDNMLSALAKVETKYVLVALDDYWLTATVNEPRLLEIYEGMQVAHGNVTS